MNQTTLNEILEKAKNSKILDLKGQPLTEENIQAIAETIPGIPGLVGIDLTESSISSEYAVRLFAAIGSCQSLLHLNLTLCKLDDTSILALCKNINHHPSLLSLELADNHIKLKSVEAITDLLKNNKKILSMNLFGNDLGMMGAKILAALEENSTLIRLNILSSSLFIDTEEAIHDKIKQNRQTFKQSIIKKNQYNAVPLIPNSLVEYLESLVPDFVERPLNFSTFPMIYLAKWQAQSLKIGCSSPTLLAYKLHGESDKIRNTAENFKSLNLDDNKENVEPLVNYMRNEK